MIKIYKTLPGVVFQKEDNFYLSSVNDWDELMTRENIYRVLEQESVSLSPIGDVSWLNTQKILPPIGSQEIWAAGVTYLRSKVARMEESEESGGATFY